MKAAVYCRVSTDDQEKEGTSLQTQLQACLAYCDSKGHQIARQFSETYSGLTLERPKLAELRDLIRTKAIDVVVVYCLDRLSRNATHGVILRDDFERNHVALESVTEDIDKTPLGEAITYLRGTFAQIEAEKIRERTMRGKLARLKEGKLPHGTGKGIYGYQWHPDTGKRTVIDEEANAVQKIFAMVQEGYSFNRIAVELNKMSIKTKGGVMWHPLTVRRIAGNETYTGRTYSGRTKRIGKTKVAVTPEKDWFLLPNVTPPIIDEETFTRTQEAMKQKKLARPLKTHAAYLLTGFARCPKCGSPLGGTTMGGKYRYYQCRGARPTASRGKICDAGYIKADWLDEEVYGKVVDLLSSPDSVLSKLVMEQKQSPEHVVTLLNKQIDDLRKRLRSYPRKEANFYDLLSHEAVTKDYVLDAVNALKKERDADERQLEQLLQSRTEATRAEHLSVKLSDFARNTLYELNQRFYMPHGPVASMDWEADGSVTLHLTPEQIQQMHDDKRQLFESVRLKVQADQKQFQLSVILAGKIIGTGSTSQLASFNKALKKFEKAHPEVTVKDMLDSDLTVAQDTPFGQQLAQLRANLVTIEQTSASQHMCSCPRRAV